jgi:hypothetical protein
MKSLFYALVLITTTALANDEPPASVFVTAHHNCDRVALEALVSGTSEARLIEILSHGARHEVLAVIRGSAGAHDLVAVMGSLARIASDGDPELAPAASMALVRITSMLTPVRMSEHTWTEVRLLVAPFVSLSRAEHVRADLRATSNLVQTMLAASH